MLSRRTLEGKGLQGKECREKKFGLHMNMMISETDVAKLEGMRAADSHKNDTLRKFAEEGSHFHKQKIGPKYAVPQNREACVSGIRL
eukprot:1157052-Pelagomonas_calceolata.AAC.2